MVIDKMAKANRISLNGNDWEAQHFISEAQCDEWKKNGANLKDMWLDSAESAGFLRGEDDGTALRGTVPGCDRTFLLENGLMAEPYYGRNLEQSAWAEKASWAFRKRFTIPAEWRGRRIRIDFAGIDYAASFYLNGVKIGEHLGAFIPCGWDITDLAAFGEENVLAVSFLPAPQGTPNHHTDGRPADFSYFHRTQIGFGWDWSRKFVPTGIWDDVTLSAYGQARLVDWHAELSEGGVALSLELEAYADGAKIPVAATLTPPPGAGGPAVVQEELCLPCGVSSHVLRFALGEVRRWMPVGGAGRPWLYGLRLALDGEEVLDRPVGFKELSMKFNPEAPEGAMPLLFEVNGEAVYISGVNWVPPDLMPSRVRPEDYEYLVALAANAGVNLFRVWGGGELEKDAFYEACDRHGVMVWHEFYHACSNSPKDDGGYLAFKEREARSVLRRLRRHVSLSLVCGGNETQYYGEIPDAPLVKMYGEVSAELAPALPYHVSSPDRSRPGERPHGPWHFMSHGDYNGHFRLLSSEYGCNAMPPFDSLAKFIPEAECAAMKGQSLLYHFFVPSHNGDPRSFAVPLSQFQIATSEQYCRATMFAQADVARYMTEHHRRQFPRTSGAIFWQYNEPWPTCAWSLVDYYGRPKQAVYALREAAAPILLSLEDESWCIDDGCLKATWFSTVNPAAATGGQAVAALEAWTASGQRLFRKEADMTLEAGTCLLKYMHERVPKDEIIVVRMTVDGLAAATRIYGNPSYRKFFDNPPDVVLTRLSGDDYEITNRGPSCALCVALATLPGAPATRGFFSDDYLTLLPGETRRVRFVSIADHREAGNALD